jgi:hypothetical protein
MSQITPTNPQLQPTINDANTAQNRGQPAVAPASAAAAPTAATAPADTVQISNAAQTAGGQGGGTALTEEEAQATATNLRQQLGLSGLSASAKQNASVLALLRPGR